MAEHTFLLAPLRGVTDLAFRQAYCAHFGGLDLAVAPFIATVPGTRVKPELLRSILPERQPAGLPLIPQIIGKDPEQLRVMLRAMQALGYADVDLNAGCPWPFVAKKGRGAGLLREGSTLEALLEVGCEVLGPGHFSLKVRLGLDTPDLLARRLPDICRYPLRELCVHPRTARQMYEGTVDLDAFERVAAQCTLPLVYNGDLRSLADFERLTARFPNLSRWMIGRGLVANPFLVESLRAGHDTRDLARFQAWHQTLLEAIAADAPGEHALIGHLKELWSYLAPAFANGDRLWNSLKLARTRAEFQSLLSLFPLRFR